MSNLKPVGRRTIVAGLGAVFVALTTGDLMTGLNPPPICACSQPHEWERQEARIVSTRHTPTIGEVAR